MVRVLWRAEVVTSTERLHQELRQGMTLRLYGVVVDQDSTDLDGTGVEV